MSSTAGLAASVLRNGVVYSGSAIVNGVNAITPHFAGAVDILVVIQPDGTLKSSPFYVRFGKYSSYRARDRRVKIFINGKETALKMHLGSYGQAYFVTERAISQLYQTSDEKEEFAGLVSPSSGYSDNEENAPVVTEETVEFVIKEAQRLRKADDADADDNEAESILIPKLGNLQIQRQDSTHGDRENLFLAEASSSTLIDKCPLSVESGARQEDREESPGEASVFDEVCLEEDQGQEQDENNKLSEMDGGYDETLAGLSTMDGSLAGFELSLCRDLLKHDMSVEETQAIFEQHKIQHEDFRINGVEISQNPMLVCRMGGVLYPWSVAAPMILGTLAFGGSWLGLIQKDSGQNLAPKEESPLSTRKASSGWRLWPFSGWWENSNTTEALNHEESFHDIDPNVISPSQQTCSSQDVHGMNFTAQQGHRVVTKKTLTPNEEQLESLHLHSGQNSISFRIGDNVKQDAYIYVISWKSRLVISDIDGTVTRSDLLGHLLPPIGVDWTHSGVTHLFSNIKANGYEIVFLSSRAIAQANITRDFLHSLEQENVKMPSGPVIISPHGLLPSLYREMILRRPHDFKIGCLLDIRILFPDHWNPFHAGFGNRETDVISYERSGVPSSRIFTINPRGVTTRGDTTSIQTSTWSSLQSINELVNEVFPCHESSNPAEIQREEFNEFHHWRIPDWTLFEDDDDPMISESVRSLKARVSYDEQSSSRSYTAGQIAQSILQE